MPPPLAALICFLFILYLFKKDSRKTNAFSWALVVPMIWMFLAGSRYVSHWLNLGGYIDSSDPYLEGSPADRLIFLCLIISGIATLLRRNIEWRELFSQNYWVLLFFVYGGISVIWSDYPFVSIKRLFKAMGNVVMALVILTERQPFEAIALVLRGLGFILLPLSALFIKYYPHLGRVYHMGHPVFTGVGMQKNALGQICLITGIYFCWSILLTPARELRNGGRLDFTVVAPFIVLIVWLFYMANSATSLTCMIVSICIFLASRLRWVSRVPRRILTVGVIFIVLLAVLQLSIDVKTIVLDMLNRDPTLTTRLPMWMDLISMVHNPLIGFGYETFWTGERQDMVSQIWGVDRQAHNGYLEIYLNLGVIGLFLLVGSIVSGLKKVSDDLVFDYSTGILRLCFIVVVALYNWTEASICGVSNIWVLLLLGIIQTPSKRILPNEHTVKAPPS